MEFGCIASIEKRQATDALVIPCWKGVKRAELAVELPQIISSFLYASLEVGDFKGEEGSVLFLYPEKEKEKRFILLGIGKEEHLTTEILRKSYGSLVKNCLSKKIKTLNICVPKQKKIVESLFFTAIAEGILLPNYSFLHLKKETTEEEFTALIHKVCWITDQKDVLKYAEKASIIADAVYYARDLVNGNADDITPQHLDLCAKGLAKEQPLIKTIVFDKKRIEKEEMGLLLAVNRGSSTEPAFIIMEYKGNPSSKDHTVIIGKGVTYDTGGLNLKPTGGMETMKCDMAGAAACFGAILATANLQLPVNLTAVIPTTENSIDANSFKPGDVYRSYQGKTVEMMNSDAEGRLILADALAYAVKKLKPSRLIDLATLTGAIEIALGSEATGLMSTNQELADALMLAGEVTKERLWQMPLYEEYKEKLKSDIADIKSWNGRSASSSVAATFLRAFVDESIPWAHLDIAGTAYVTEPKKYQPKYATGVGVRLLVEFLSAQNEEQISKKKRVSKK